MYLRMFVVVFAALFSELALADSVDINLSNDDIQVTYGNSFRSAELTAGALYNEDDDWAVHVGLVALGEKRGRSSRSDAGLGGRLYYASAGDNDAVALGLGGQFRWFPGNGAIGLGAYAFYAPDIVTGADAERFWDAGVRVEIEVVRRTASVYLGYSKVEMRLEDGPDVTVNKGGHVGLSLKF